MFVFSALPPGSGGVEDSSFLQRKRSKNGGDISADFEALQMEEPDSTVRLTPASNSSMSYANTLKNPVDRFTQTMTEEFVMTEEDYSFSEGTHGPNVSFSGKVHNKLDFEWRCAVIVKLMGKPNSSNTFDFLLRGLRRKWQLKGGWQLIDLPNDYFIVKFNLDEDMNHALCGGPWILSGQTLVVQKWRPDFDPMTEHIGKMALWVRICGLPVKFFKSYTVAAIGKILGTVVKVDQVTIGQARGKFARVCIEVDLSKPLRPFVEVEGVAYGVVYEGISMICFECGCYGHVKDKCPYVHQENGSKDQTNEVVINESVSIAANGSQTIAGEQEMETNQKASAVSSFPTSVLKGDMGPWMLMTYKNKKKVPTENGGTKKVQISGSRFNVLQDENGNEHTDNGDSATVGDRPIVTSGPPIVKLWKNFQDKALKSTELKITSDKVVEKSKDLKITGDKVVEKSKDKLVMNEKTQRLKAKVPARHPMKDVSNKVAGSSSNRSTDTMKYQRKHRAINSLGGTNLDPHVPFVVSQENNVQCVSVPAIFGHCPPEESMIGEDNTVIEKVVIAADCYAEKTFAENSVLSHNDDSPSHNEEGMVSDA